MDTEQPLNAALDPRLDSGLLQLVSDDLLSFGEEGFPLLAAGVNGFFYLLVPQRIEEAESQVLKLAPNFAHAKAVSDGGIYLQCLFGNLVLAVGVKMLQRAHIVQAVG